MDDQQVKEHFKKQTGDYVGLMARIIPEYVFGQKFLCNLIPFEKDKHFKILDLGAGTGGLSELALNKYSNSNSHIFDLTREMIEICKDRFSQYNERVSFQQGDYKSDPIGTGYHVIFAGLTLHHLRDTERKRVLRLLYDSLVEGGIFISREVVVDEDPVVREENYKLWRDFMNSNGEDGEFWYKKHRQKDHPISVRNQLSWLEAAGFKRAVCHDQHLNFAIFSALKLRNL